MTSKDLLDLVTEQLQWSALLTCLGMLFSPITNKILRLPKISENHQMISDFQLFDVLRALVHLPDETTILLEPLMLEYR